LAPIRQKLIYEVVVALAALALTDKSAGGRDTVLSDSSGPLNVETVTIKAEDAISFKMRPLQELRWTDQAHAWKCEGKLPRHD
jgi:hypothetical protein